MRKSIKWLLYLNALMVGGCFANGAIEFFGPFGAIFALGGFVVFLAHLGSENKKTL